MTSIPWAYSPGKTPPCTPGELPAQVGLEAGGCEGQATTMLALQSFLKQILKC